MTERKITTVISDFGGVLTTPLYEAFAAFQRQSGIPPEALGEAMLALTERDGQNPLFELETGRLSEADFGAHLSAELSERLGRDVEMTKFAEYYFAHLHPNDELIGHLRGLRERRGYRLALLTNNVREWEPRWRAMLPVDELFELVVDSAFVGVRKPDPEIYALTLERLGEPGEHCLFVDDFAHNCEAARVFGMTAVHYVSNEQAIAEIEAALAANGAGR
jgi:putative hydrolase of the HAD superfamily